MTYSDGEWYILIVPLGALLFLLVTISGVYDWLYKRLPVVGALPLHCLPAHRWTDPHRPGQNSTLIPSVGSTPIDSLNSGSLVRGSQRTALMLLRL